MKKWKNSGFSAQSSPRAKECACFWTSAFLAARFARGEDCAEKTLYFHFFIFWMSIFSNFWFSLRRNAHFRKGNVHLLEGNLHSLKGNVNLLKGNRHFIKGNVHSLKGNVHLLKGRIVRNCKSLKNALHTANWTIPHYENGSLDEQFQVHERLKMTWHVLILFSWNPVYPNRGRQYKLDAIPDPPTPP